MQMGVDSMLRITQLKLTIDQPIEALREVIRKKLNCDSDDFTYTIYKESIDARQRGNDFIFSYTADDGTSLTLLFFQFIAFKQLRTLFLIDSAHDIPDRELSVSHKLGTGIEEAVRGDGYLFSPQLTPFVAVLCSLYMAGYLHLKGAEIKFLLPLRQFIVKISQFPVLAS